MFYNHDFDHVIRVGDRATIIAETPEVGFIAGAAGLCHNTDRILQKMDGSGPFGKVENEDIVGMVCGWLDAEPTDTFSDEDRLQIYDAVLHHSERNSHDDSPVLVTLKDADRTVNIEADVIFRKAQLLGDTMRVIDPIHGIRDPRATFENPGSILRSLEFDRADFQKAGGVAEIRLPKAKVIARSRLAFLRIFIRTVMKQRHEAGLLPYPSFE